eukprot:3935028-Rhodomonas_salina.1
MPPSIAIGGCRGAGGGWGGGKTQRCPPTIRTESFLCDLVLSPPASHHSSRAGSCNLLTWMVWSVDGVVRAAFHALSEQS